VKTHPQILASQAREAASRERRREAQLGYLPRLDVVAALWARGSGFTGTAVSPSSDGLWPNAPNWGAGIVLVWPSLDLFANRERVRGAEAAAQGADARRREVELVIRTQVDTARQILEGARRVAQNTPAALEAARAAEQQASARYQAGLANITEVADAQRLLAEAELEDVTARLGVRTAMLLLARALGDLEPFLNEARGGP
jgi:outer membrane protein TolC